VRCARVVRIFRSWHVYRRVVQLVCRRY
jgi:hypothetical protein